MRRDNQNWYPLAAIAIAILLLSALSRQFFFILLMLFGFLALLGLGYFLFNFLWQLSKKNSYDSSIEGSLERQFVQSKVQIEKNKSEIKEIQKAIDDLESSLDNKLELIEKNRQQSKRILAGFYKELELRKAKIEFYETCKIKLETLNYNHNFSQELASKQQKLSKLQEDHFDDIASMETFKANLEYNKHFMETIETLSLRMLESTSLDSAQQLQLELKEITKELKRL
jgi:hypothetical protein